MNKDDLIIKGISLSEDKKRIIINACCGEDFKFDLKLTEFGVVPTSDFDRIVFNTIERSHGVMKLMKDFREGRQVRLPARFEYIDYPPFDPSRGFDQFEDAEIKVPVTT